MFPLSPKKMRAARCLWLCLGIVGMLSLWGGETVDLGVVDAHHKVACGFALTNDTHATRHVLGARSSCACMAVEVRRGDWRAGEILPVKVLFDPRGMEGLIEKTVQVDIKSRAPIVRSYRAQVRLRLGFKPSDAAFGVMRSTDASRTLTATLSGYAASNAVVTAVMPPPHAFFEVVAGHAGRVTVPNVAPDVVGSAPRADRLFVRFKSPHPLPGTYAETWRIRTSDPDIPEIAFPVSARIADGFSITPQVLTINATSPVRSRVPRDRDDATSPVRSRVPRDRPLRTVSRTVTLRRDDRKPFKVLAADTKPRKWGDARIVPRPLNGWAVVVENIDPDAVRQFSKKPYLEIKTDLPEAVSLMIPMRVE